MQILRVDAQFASNQPGGFATDHPVLHGRSFEGLVITFVLGVRFVVHMCAPSSHIYTTPVHQIEARPVAR